MEVEIKDYERVDDLHRKGYKIIQNPENFCFGVDAVLLSGFACVKKGMTVIDLCTGTGIIPILLECKTLGSHFTGVEVLGECVDMAKRSVALNGISDKIDIIEADIKNIFDYFNPSEFDVVTSNPPYMKSGSGLLNPFDKKAVARHEILCSLEDVIYCASKLLKTGGAFYMIHRPHRLSEIFFYLNMYKLEPKKMRFVHSKIEKEPSMVLIEAVRSAKPFLTVMPPLVIYNDYGNYTDEVYKIYYE